MSTRPHLRLSRVRTNIRWNPYNVATLSTLSTSSSLSRALSESERVVVQTVRAAATLILKRKPKVLKATFRAFCEASKAGSENRKFFVHRSTIVGSRSDPCVRVCVCVCASVGACVRKCCMCTRGPFAKNILRPVSRAGMQISQPAPSHTILSLLTHPYTHSHALTHIHSHTPTK